MNEQQARAVVLAEAVETADPRAELLDAAERERLDAQAIDAARAGMHGKALPAPAGAAPPALTETDEANKAAVFERFLQDRAARITLAAQGRDPLIATALERRPWAGALVAWVPLGAFVLGLLSDRIANPHRVDLLSLPLLAIVFWNLAAYLLLAWFWLRARQGGLRRLQTQPRPPAALQRWAEQRWLAHVLKAVRGGATPARTAIAHQFLLRWNAVAAPLNAQRWKKVLHLSAAAWGAGVAASLLGRGLVVAYRVGWESTFLGAGQVHAFLSALFAPVVALLSLAPFSVAEVAALQFGGEGSAGAVAAAASGMGAGAGARWVLLYAGLLGLVVVAPRLALAALAAWRARALAADVAIGLDQTYYQRLAARLWPTRVRVALLTHRPEDRALLLRVLLQDTDLREIREVHEVRAIASAEHDEMLVLDLPASGHLPVGCDLVLHGVAAPADAQAAAPLLDRLGKPVLEVSLTGGVTGGTAGPQDSGGRRYRHEALPFDSFGRCWVQDRVLLEALGRCLPELKAPGFARLAEAWHARNRTRFQRSIATLAVHLLDAARLRQQVGSAPLSVRNLISAAERDSQARARQAAIGTAIDSLAQSDAAALAQLLRLHGIENHGSLAPAQRPGDRFVFRQAINSPQAGLAGAASGAAMGASVDLMVGGLTLGAAAALGALVGGSAGYVAAALKNRAGRLGVTVIELGDDMLRTLALAGLLRYLAVAHLARAGAASGGLAPALEEAIAQAAAQAVAVHEVEWSALWARARRPPQDAGDADAASDTDSRATLTALADRLEQTAMAALDSLYPATAVGPRLPAGTAGPKSSR